GSFSKTDCYLDLILLPKETSLRANNKKTVTNPGPFAPDQKKQIHNLLIHKALSLFWHTACDYISRKTRIKTK
ncbi:MAG: hypothetical protein CSA52_04175, partial [Gammaproteobacteria bacterium]